MTANEAQIVKKIIQGEPKEEASNAKYADEEEVKL